SDLAAIPLVTQVIDGRRKIVFLYALLRVDEDTRATAGRHPLVVHIAERLGNAFIHLGRKVREKFRDRAKRAAILSPEHVRWRLITFFLEQRRELGRASVADIRLDSGVSLELLDDRTDQCLTTTRIDREFLGLRRSRKSECKGNAAREKFQRSHVRSSSRLEE